MQTSTRNLDYENYFREEETKEEEFISKIFAITTVSTKKITKQKTIQERENINTKLEKFMTKADEKIIVLAMYEIVEFYIPEVIYEDQLNIFDNRQLHLGVDLVEWATIN